MKFSLLQMLLFLFFASLLQAQDKVTLSGKVSTDDQQALQIANVYVGKYSLGAYTDSTGRFQISLPKGQCEISFSYIGFEPQQFSLFLTRDTFIEVVMKETVMGEVTITEKKEAKTMEHEEGGIMILKKEIFYLLPAFLGENDPLKAVQMQPGIQSGNEGSRGIFVRGGSPDQNLMLLDGVPVYNPSHVYGFVSVFNGDAIESINVYKDKYPARFGGRLCSVMDIAADEGNSEKLRGSVSVGLVTSRVHLDGPLTKKKQTTFSFSARGCYIGLYTAPISKRQFEAAGESGDISYYFGDINVKAVHRFNDKNKLEVNFFTNRDYYSYLNTSDDEYTDFTEEGKYENAVDWSNNVVSAAWVNDWNGKWGLTNRVSFSRYNLNGSLTDNYSIVDKNNGNNDYFKKSYSEVQSFINNTGWSGDAIYKSNKHTLRLGAGVNSLIYETGRGASSLENSFGDNFQSLDSSDLDKPWEAFTYAEDEFLPHEKITLGYGLHTRFYFTERKTFFNFLPRVSALYNPVENFFIRASMSGLSQNLHLLTASNADVLNDYWVPATRKAAPETGWNFSGGVVQKLPQHFEWSVDGFYRIMNNLIEYKDDENYSQTDVPWEEKVVTGGKGAAYGGEFYIARTAGKITGSVAYTLAWSRRKFDELNRGEYFPYKYDRRHNIAAQINWRIGRHFEVGAAWVYGSGNTYTLASQRYDTWSSVAYYDMYGKGSETIKLYTARNSSRLPAYHHLDLSFTYKKRKKNLEHLFNFSVYNVYNRFNIFSVYQDMKANNDGSREISYKQLSLFPILPSLMYTIKFSM